MQISSASPRTSRASSSRHATAFSLSPPPRSGDVASPLATKGDTIGVLPQLDPAAANPWVDIVLATGLDHARNTLVANADAVVALGGGAGTLSEMAFAWMFKRLIVAVRGLGWADRFGDQRLDARALRSGR